MNKSKPLRSTTGSPAEGKDKYFPREKIVAKILRKLRLGENLLISAPRRIGKSSILKHIKKNQQDDQIILYISVMSVDSSEEFFKKLFNELIKNEEVFSGIKGYLTRASGALRKYASRISGFSITGDVTVNPNDCIDYYNECQRLLETLCQKSTGSKKVIIFIDEFPDALLNIIGNDKVLAKKFLQQNRDLRMSFSEVNLQFVYTGSTGLNNVVKKLNKLDLVNDLVDIKVPPLSKAEATQLLHCLILGFKQEHSDFAISDEVIEYILNRITWRLPYYMQIIASELFEHFDDHEQAITAKTVDFMLAEIVKSKSSHADYFENWKKRLKLALQNDEYHFAIEVLNYTAKNDQIEYAVFYDLSVKHKVEDYKYVLNVLEHDGYISEQNRVYGFNSFLLKEWWYINVAT
jgi:hypothetical protein